MSSTGCTKAVQGPLPTLQSNREVQTVCNANNEENAGLISRVTVNSAQANFSPLPQNLLTESPQVQLPLVYLMRDGQSTELSATSFVDPSTLAAHIHAENALPAGSYEVSVQNPNGQRSAALPLLKIVDPPTISSVHVEAQPSEPATVCGGQETRLVVQGSGFRPEDPAPRLEVIACTDAQVPATCTEVIASLTNVQVDSATQLTATLPAGTLPPTAQNFGLRVTNPEATPCTGTLAQAIDVKSSAQSISAVVPRQSWTGTDTPIQIYGQDFEAGATLRIRGAGANGQDLELVDVRVDPSGTRIDATVPQGATPGTNFDIIMRGQDGCEGLYPASFTILADASLSITQVIDPFSWTQAKRSLSLLGEGFLSTPKAYLVVPSQTPSLVPLTSTTYVNTNSVGTIVPQGLPVGGPYDLVVINPDGGGGKAAQAFRVTALPPPLVSAVTPAIGDTQDNPTVEIQGCNFRSPFQVQLVAQDGSTTDATSAQDPVCDGPTTCSDGSAICRISATLPTTTLEVGGYVVRGINQDEQTWGDWSLFVNTLPSGKLSTWRQASQGLQTPRKGLAAVSGRISQSSRYLYAIGGQTLSPAQALDSIEVVPVDAFGNVGRPFEQRNKLGTPRAYLSAFARDGYIYAIGGTQDLSSGLATIERAKILTLEDQPQVTEPSLASGQLAPGAWYYQVAAVYDAAKQDNPSGETLPSDEVVVSLSVPSGVVLGWSAVPDATGYRIYRSAEPNGSSSTEVLLAQVGSDQLSYTDDGTATVDPAQRPHAPGSTGTFVPVAQSMLRARYGHSTQVAQSDDGSTFVYSIGGQGDCGSGAGEMNCIEFAPLSATNNELGAWTESAQTMVSPRFLHASCVATPDKDPQIPAPQNWLYVSGGQNASESLEASQVGAGGELSAWTNLAPPTSASPGERTGHGMQLISNAMFLIGGVSGTARDGAALSNAQFSQEFDASATDRSSFSNSTAELATPRSEYGLVLESGMFYAIGGATGPTSNEVTGTIEAIVY